MSRALQFAVGLLVFASGCVGAPSDLELPEFERAGPRCVTDAQCDDGIACNGVERCTTVTRRCAGGEPIVCEPDALSCTVETCEEPGVCVIEPRTERCGTNQFCDVDRGCVIDCASPVAVCDLATGCGCLADEGCYAPGNEGLVCAPAGVARDDEDCDLDVAGGGCARGFQCVQLGPPGSPARCRRVCDEQQDESCLEDTSCSVALTRVDARVCTQACDIFDGTGCGEGTGCDLLLLPGAVDNSFYSDCRARGVLPRQAPCTADAECGPGMFCVSGLPTEDRCLGLCRTSDDCRSDERCGGFVEEVRVDEFRVYPCLER